MMRSPVIRVVVARDPKVDQGEMVRLEAMTVQRWETDGRSGQTYRAARSARPPPIGGIVPE